MTPIACLQRLQESAPRQVLFAEADRQLDAQTLFARAARLAAQLQAQGIGTGSNVALYLPRGLDAVVAVYGILLAGACYVPLHRHCPGNSNRLIVQDAGCRCVLMNDTVPSWIRAAGLDVIDVATVPDCPPISDPVPMCRAEDPAAILYTSGSTGRPKGVVISQHAISTFSDWSVSTFGLNRDDRIASLAPFNFDLSLFDLFATPAAVVGVPDQLSGTRIAAAVAVEGADRSSLQAHASRELATWMRPSFYLLMKDLPFLPNGKTDYQGISRAIEEEMSG